MCVVFSFTFLFLYTDQFNFWTTGHAKSAFHYLFSIKSFAKIINYLFDTNYIILLVFSYLFFIFLSIKFFIFFKKKKIFNFFNLYDTEDKLFIIGINTLVLCYLIFSNYYYREIFLILGLPLLIKLRDRNKSNFTNYLFSFVIIKYLFLFLYNYFLLQETYYHVDGVRIFYGFFIILIAIKSIFDFILMSILASFLISYNMQIIKKINFRHFY